MLCTEEGMSEIFYMMNQNLPLYYYQVTLIGTQNQYFEMLYVFVLIKSAQPYMFNDKEELFFPCFLPGKQDFPFP